MGSIYKRGNVWWIRYRRNGKNLFESSKSQKKTVAKKLLERREGAIADGRDPGKIYERVTYEDLRRDIVNDYEVNGKNIRRLMVSLAHLDDHFDGFKVNQITTSEITEYTGSRLKWKCKDCEREIGENEICPHCGSDNIRPPASNATINRELSALKRMLRLGYQADCVVRVPFIPMLKEDNVRQGFFDHSEYINLLKALPSYIRPIATFGYRTGWRKAEILGLTWGRVDLKERTVALTPDQTKNKEARSLYLDDELLRLFKLQHLKKIEGCQYVFHRKGKKISNFRKAWKKACKKVGLEGRLFHDFRRTAARNLRRSGTSETVAMKITGHKTRAVFDRYNITSQDDIREAMQRQESYLSQGSVTKTVTMAENQSMNQVEKHGQVVNIS